MTTSMISHYTVYCIGRTKAHDAEIDLFHKGRRVGILYFYESGKDLPEDKETINGPYLHFKISRFHEILHVLQSEKPMYIRWDDSRGQGYIQSSWEPVGEEEGT